MKIKRIKISNILRHSASAEHYLDIPKEGYQYGIYTFPISGYVVGKTQPVTAVEIVVNNRVIETIPLTVKRPNVINKFRELAQKQDFQGFKSDLIMINQGKT